MLRDMCPGLYVSEQYPSVHILMYADDLTLVNDTVGRVQNELNVLNQFCQNYGMTMNLKKIQGYCISQWRISQTK